MRTTIRAALQTYHTYYKSNRTVSRPLFDKLNQLGVLSQQQQDKIQFYVGQGLLVQLWYQTLSNKTDLPSQAAIAQFSAWTPFYDDLMDEKGLTHQAILDSTANDKTAYSKHFNWLFNQSFDQIKNKEQVLHFFNQVGAAQNKSLQQKDHSITTDSILEITREKGGWATCFYASANGHLSVPWVSLFYEIGACLQLCNDIFDIYKDHQSGIQTLPIRDIELTKQTYQKWISNSKQILSELPINHRAKRNFWKQVMLIISRGEIALNLLLKLKDLNSNQLILNKLNRKQLICDMERPINIWRSFMRTTKNKLVTSTSYVKVKT